MPADAAKADIRTVLKSGDTPSPVTLVSRVLNTNGTLVGLLFSHLDAVYTIGSTIRSSRVLLATTAR